MDSPPLDPTGIQRQGEYKLRLVRPQFGLRAFLLSVMVVAGLLGWFAWQLRQQREQRRIVAIVQRANGVVRYDFQSEDNPVQAKASSFATRCLRNAFGKDFYSNVESITFFGTFSNVYVEPRTEANDRAIAEASRLPGLKKVVVSLRGPMSDRGIRSLSSCATLQSLQLSHTRITEECPADIAKLPNLQWLYIQGTPISDAGLAKLESMKQLTFLAIEGGYGRELTITQDGKDRLHKSLPKCELRFD